MDGLPSTIVRTVFASAGSEHHTPTKSLTRSQVTPLFPSEKLSKRLMGDPVTLMTFLPLLP
jgi:hypothetical protein